MTIILTYPDILSFKFCRKEKNIASGYHNKEWFNIHNGGAFAYGKVYSRKRGLWIDRPR